MISLASFGEQRTPTNLTTVGTADNSVFSSTESGFSGSPRKCLPRISSATTVHWFILFIKATTGKWAFLPLDVFVEHWTKAGFDILETRGSSHSTDQFRHFICSHKSSSGNYSTIFWESVNVTRKLIASPVSVFSIWTLVTMAAKFRKVERYTSSVETRKAGQMYGDGFQISNTSHLMAYSRFQVSSKIIPLVYILLLF